jgi:hypothetical protein
MYSYIYANVHVIAFLDNPNGQNIDHKNNMYPDLTGGKYPDVGYPDNSEAAGNSGYPDFTGGKYPGCGNLSYADNHGYMDSIYQEDLNGLRSEYFSDDDINSDYSKTRYDAKGDESSTQRNDNADTLRKQRVRTLLSDLPTMSVSNLKRLMDIRYVRY